MIERLSGRRQCSNGHVYHVEFDPPKHEGRCDLRQAAQAARRRRAREGQKRLQTYHEQTEPLIDYYEERACCVASTARAPTEVHDHIRATLATLRLEERL